MNTLYLIKNKYIIKKKTHLEQVGGNWLLSIAAATAKIAPNKHHILLYIFTLSTKTIDNGTTLH